MSPTIVLRNGRPELVVGGSGGPTIISGTVQVVLGVVAFGMDVPDAVAAPRIHDQAVPPVLVVEPGIAAPARAMLVRLGHDVKPVPMLGAVSAAGIGRDGTAEAAGDARKDGGAALAVRARVGHPSP
jgi:gamma-glutamyltranspeptidase/glutathione hydrolase